MAPANSLVSFAHAFDEMSHCDIMVASKILCYLLVIVEIPFIQILITRDDEEVMCGFRTSVPAILISSKNVCASEITNRFARTGLTQQANGMHTACRAQTTTNPFDTNTPHPIDSVERAKPCEE